MKNKIFGFCSLLLVAGFFNSCNDSDEVDGIVDVNKPTMTINIPTAVTVNEGDEIPFTVTLSEPVGHEFTLFIVADSQGSTANNFDSDVENSTSNISYQKTVTIPPFVTSYSDVITIYNDDLAEGAETLRLFVGDTRTSAVIFQPVVSTITINNVVSDELVLSLNFDREFSGDGGYKNTLCELESSLSTNPNGSPVAYDVDFLLYDSLGADTGNASAQTAACVEEMVIDLNDYADGIYQVRAYLYTNADLDLASMSFPLVGAGEFNIPITVNYLRSGGIDAGTFNQEDAYYLTSLSPVDTEVPVVDIVISTVAGGARKFTIQDTTGLVSASGKSSVKSKHKK